MIPETEKHQEAKSVCPDQPTQHAQADPDLYFTQSPQYQFSRGTVHEHSCTQIQTLSVYMYRYISLNWVKINITTSVDRETSRPSIYSSAIYLYRNVATLASHICRDSYVKLLLNHEAMIPVDNCVQLQWLKASRSYAMANCPPCVHVCACVNFEHKTTSPL